MKLRKLTIGLFSVAISSMFFSCSDNETFGQNDAVDTTTLQLSSEEIMSVAYDDVQYAGEDEIPTLISDFLNSKIGDKTTVKAVEIQDKYYLGSSENTLTRSTSETSEAEIPIYKVKVDAGGQQDLALFCPDERTSGVVAYIENINSQEDLENSGASFLLDLAEKSVLQDINKYETLKKELRDKTLDKIEAEYGTRDFRSVEDKIAVKTETRSTPQTDINSYTTKMSPICTVLWAQQSPYNGLLDEYTYTFWGEQLKARYPAGCAVIAIAQALSVEKPSMTCYGTTINWSTLTSSSSITDYSTTTQKNMVQNLIKHIYVETGTYPVFGTDGMAESSTKISSVKSYLERYCNTNGIIEWNDGGADATLSSLLTIHPVIASGVRYNEDGSVAGSHAWVIDGFAITQKGLYREIVKNNDLFWHANMGWSGSSNGWYKINSDLSMDWETSMGNYKGELYVIPSIKKK